MHPVTTTFTLNGQIHSDHKPDEQVAKRCPGWGWGVGRHSLRHIWAAEWGGLYVPHSFLIDRIEWSTTNVLCNVPPMQTFPQPLRPDITALVDWA